MISGAGGYETDMSYRIVKRVSHFFSFVLPKIKIKRLRDLTSGLLQDNIHLKGNSAVFETLCCTTG